MEPTNSGGEQLPPVAHSAKIPHECGVSDGSLQNQHGTYAWIVEDTSSTDWIAGLKPRQQWQPQLIFTPRLSASMTSSYYPSGTY